MCEPQVRAAISVFRTEELAPLSSVFTRLYPILLKRLMAEVAIRPLRIEVGSKMGGPVYARVDDKLEQLQRTFFPMIADGDLSFLKDCYTIVNVRLQPEKRSKVREVPVIDTDGTYHIVKIEGQLRTTKFESGTFACRSRPVYNPNVANNYKQVVDNCLHDAIQEYSAYSHNLYAWRDARKLLPGKVKAIDVKHFERCVGAIVGIRATFIGEKYLELQQLILNQPYLCVGTDWKSAF